MAFSVVYFLVFGDYYSIGVCCFTHLVTKNAFDDLGHETTQHNGCKTNQTKSGTFDDRYLILVFFISLNRKN